MCSNLTDDGVDDVLLKVDAKPFMAVSNMCIKTKEILSG